MKIKLEKCNLYPLPQFVYLSSFGKWFVLLFLLLIDGLSVCRGAYE